MTKFMKTILVLLLCYQGICFRVCAQQPEPLTPVLRHLQNPEVKKVIQLYSEGRFTEIEKTFRNLKELKSDDALDLMVFAASRVKNESVINWQWISNEYTMKLLQSYVDEKSIADEELYRKGIINYVMGILLSNKNLLITSFTQLDPLAQKGWKETTLPITDILYEIYVNQYHPLKTEEIVPVIIQGVQSKTVAANVIDQLASGLEDPYASVATAERRLVQERKLFFAKVFLEQLVAEKNKNANYIFRGLFGKSAMVPGITSESIEYREEYVKNLESIINNIISKNPEESLSLHQLSLIRKMIYDSPAESSQLAQKIVSLHQSKKEAFNAIEEFLNGIPYNAAYETLAESDKKWTEVFEDEFLTWNLEHLPLLLRHTDLYIPFLKSNKVEIPVLLKALDFQNYVSRSLSEDVNKIAFNPEFLPEIIYDMYDRVRQIRSLPAYQDNTELKYLEAQYLMLFHEYHAQLNQIHSARILSFNSTFDHWKSAEVKNFPKNRAVDFVNTYRATLSKSGRFVGSMEYDTVLSEIDKFIKKFNLK